MKTAFVDLDVAKEARLRAKYGKAWRDKIAEAQPRGVERVVLRREGSVIGTSQLVRSAGLAMWHHEGAE